MDFKKQLNYFGKMQFNKTKLSNFALYSRLIFLPTRNKGFYYMKKERTLRTLPVLKVRSFFI